MRHLVLMRGAMGSGKSTWIKNNGLQQYTLCADDIRLLFQTPVLNERGKFSISAKNDRKVWNFLFTLLEERMKRGEFTIVDATHARTANINQYKHLAGKYRYRVTIVDFSDVPEDVALQQNLQRPEYKQVPEEAIRTVYSRFGLQAPSNWVKVIKPEEFHETMRYKPIDLSHWKKIHHIGDIHGCYDVLMDYLNGNGVLKEDELYIFVGDFVDRGIQNFDVLLFMVEIMDCDNVIFLEGNHEIHLWNWANDEEVRSKQFINITQKELEANSTDVEQIKKLVRMFYRKLRQIVYYTYNEKWVVVTHGGISTVPKNFMFIATEQFVKGVGKYETPIDEEFVNNTLGFYQIHGHRNIQQFPVQVNERCFNLEGKVEMGGHLRVVTLDANGFETFEIKNNIYDKRFYVKQEQVTANVPLLDMLRSNNLVLEKKYGNISSFNFKEKVFYDKLWDNQNVKARGLFINTNTNEIVARSYNKFFNINEREETKIQQLGNTLKFPVNIYLKENGFLGILGYNSENDELVFTSKSEVEGHYAQYFKDIFYKQVEPETIHGIKQYLKQHNVTFVFEVIDPVNDPHIIEYPTSEIVLLDVVYRTEVYDKKSYPELVAIAHAFKLQCKYKVLTINSWTEFHQWYTGVTSFMYDKIEGYVIEDAEGFMTKVKIPYYNFWKHMRKTKDRLASDKIIDTGTFFTPLANVFFGWIKEKDKDELRKKDIITLRKEFFAQI